MARLNGLVTSSRRGVYWQLIDVGGPDVLTIAVSNQTPGSLKDLLRRATVSGFWPANFFASYGATRLAVTRGSNVAVTTSDGLVCTNVNLLPSGAMN
jgi:hypothetical protein